MRNELGNMDNNKKRKWYSFLKLPSWIKKMVSKLRGERLSGKRVGVKYSEDDLPAELRKIITNDKSKHQSGPQQGYDTMSLWLENPQTTAKDGEFSKQEKYGRKSERQHDFHSNILFKEDLLKLANSEKDFENRIAINDMIKPSPQYQLSKSKEKNSRKNVSAKRNSRGRSM